MTALVMGALAFVLYLVVRGAARLRGGIAVGWQVLGGLVLLGLVVNILRELVNGPRDQLLGFTLGAAVAPMVVGAVERLVSGREAS